MKKLSLSILALVALACTSSAPVPRDAQKVAAAVPGAAASQDLVSSKVALIDFFPTLGDPEPNIEALQPLVEEAYQAGANIVIAPELATTGYAITAQQVIDGLGIENPFPQLDRLGELAMVHHGYLMIGIAEIDNTGTSPVLYNSVVVYGPGGLIGVQRKRGVAGWNARGNLPFETIPTPYGDLSGVICSDSYLQDWIRISTLAGADIIGAPANWWGETGQVGIWQTRAQENGVWMTVANRWGIEKDTRYDPPYTADMNNAPTTFIAPGGEVRELYRPNQTPPPFENKILYYDVEVPRSQIGSTANPTYSVAQRRPSAYGAIANQYYIRDQGNVPVPGLPPIGPTSTAVLSYAPTASPEMNLQTIETQLGARASEIDLLVLPGLGLTARAIACDDTGWASKAPWSSLQSFTDKNEIDLVVTTAFVSCPQRLALVVLQKGQPARLRAQIHDAWGLPGSGEEPLYLDLPHARVGLLTGVDFLFPEIATQMAKSGADMIAVSSFVAAPPTGLDLQKGPIGWRPEDLTRTWRVRTDQCFHVAASDASGNGAIVQDGGCFAMKTLLTDTDHPLEIFTLESETERKKLLNTYYDFDLEALLD